MAVAMKERLNHFTLYTRGYSETVELIAQLSPTLEKDASWYFIPNPQGTLLRVEPQSAKALTKKLKQMEGLKWLEEKPFEPKKDEHLYARFVGEDLAPIFHAVSMLAIKYPPKVMEIIFERMCHIFMFQIGIMDWKREAEILGKLALRRAELYGRHGFTTTEWHD